MNYLVYTAKWLSPEQLAEIIGSQLTPEGSLYCLDLSNQLVISDKEENLDKIRVQLATVDVQEKTISDDILGSFAVITGTLEVNDAANLKIHRRVKCGDSVSVDNYEKVLYKIGKLNEDDRFMLCGNLITFEPVLQSGEFSLKMKFECQNIVGWDKNGEPITTKHSIEKNFQLENGKEMLISLGESGDQIINLRLLATLEDYLG